MGEGQQKVPPAGAAGRVVSEGTEVVGLILPCGLQLWVHVVEENRQVRAAVGNQGAEKSLTPKMTPVL